MRDDAREGIAHGWPGALEGCRVLVSSSRLPSHPSPPPPPSTCHFLLVAIGKTMQSTLSLNAVQARVPSVAGRPNVLCAAFRAEYIWRARRGSGSICPAFLSATLESTAAVSGSAPSTFASLPTAPSFLSRAGPMATRATRRRVFSSTRCAPRRSESRDGGWRLVVAPHAPCGNRVCNHQNDRCDRSHLRGCGWKPHLVPSREDGGRVAGAGFDGWCPAPHRAPEVDSPWSGPVFRWNCRIVTSGLAMFRVGPSVEPRGVEEAAAVCLPGASGH